MLAGRDGDGHGATDPRALDVVRRVADDRDPLEREVVAERERLGRGNAAIVRIEQLYPLALDELQAALAPFADGTPTYWVQEEPENMGAWWFMRMTLGERLFGRLPFSGITRPAAASPATGSHSSHKLEQQMLLTKAFAQP